MNKTTLKKIDEVDKCVEKYIIPKLAKTFIEPQQTSKMLFLIGKFIKKFTFQKY